MAINFCALSYWQNFNFPSFSLPFPPVDQLSTAGTKCGVQSIVTAEIQSVTGYIDDISFFCHFSSVSICHEGPNCDTKGPFPVVREFDKASRVRQDC